ncbi:MAG: HEAT repeat domain-containing protein [Planctomycetota bacterium]|nr:HEAT repeat domain-containing protein [Planctomycetota bacterium]
MGKLIGCLLVLAFVAGSVRSAHAEEDRVAKIETLFREGLDLYQQGKYSEAQIKLRQLLALEPRKELAARLVDEAGTKYMAKMMADPRMGSEPTRIWTLYRQYYILKLADKDRMAKMAARVVDPATSDDERALLYREFAELGHYAVPAIAQYLKDPNHEDFRTYARVVLARMGPTAILPLIELLNHKEVLMRENAILAITDIEPADERAIPALKARLEDPNETETAKRFATRALEKLTGVSAASLKPAATYYYEAANRYYIERAGVAEEAEYADGFMWHLNEGGDLVTVQYPIWAWNDQMAEELALRGAGLHMDQSDFYPLLASIYAGQYTEVKDLVDIANENPTRHFLSEEEKQEIMAWDKKLIDCLNLSSACGKYYVNEALFKVYRDLAKYPGHARLPGIGAFLAERLAFLDEKGDLLRPPSLPAAPAPVVPAGGKDPSVATSIDIVPPTAVVPVHGTQLFKAIVKDQYGKPMKNMKLTWFTEEGAGGKIDETGLFTAGPVPGGPYRVYAQAEGAPEAGIAKAEAKTDVAPEPPAKPGDGYTLYVLPGHQPAPFPGEGDNAYAPGSALIAGLDSPDQIIQYACAVSLAKINRFPQPWVGSEKVAGLLGRGVSENQPLQILVAEEDQNVRNEVRGHLEKLGYLVTDAGSGRDALIKARTFPPKDIVLISDRLRRDLTPEQLQEELRADVRTRYMPTGILHSRAERTLTQARFGTEITLVEREMADNDLKVQIEKLEGQRPAEASPKRKAHEISVKCATALSKVDPRATHLTLIEAVPHCKSALTNRKDDVRNPATIFLGNVGGGNDKDDVAAKLLGVVQDMNNIDETNAPAGTPVDALLRVNAVRALGRVKPDAFEAEYTKLQTDRSHLVQEVAAEEFGAFVRRNGQLYNFLREKRVDREKKEK